MKYPVYLYIAVMAIVTYLIRMLPMTVFRKKIKSRFLNSFLHYIPSACLAAMTFPAILGATSSTVSALAGLITALVLSYYEKSLVTVAACSCAAVFAAERLLVWLPTVI